MLTTEEPQQIGFRRHAGTLLELRLDEALLTFPWVVIMWLIGLEGVGRVRGG
jgi:hypothetical protein